MDIIICPSPNDVATKAAEILAEHAGGRMGLATGSTPLLTYKELIRMHEEGLSFAECEAFLLDEYVGLAPSHPQSYAATIRNEFTNHIDIDDARVHSPQGDSGDPHAAARAYEELLASTEVDIQLLGIGADGHIGFNEPGTSLNSRTHAVTLHPQTIADNARFFDSADQVPIHAITQGLGTISRAKRLLLLATGQNKAKAVAEMIEGGLSAFCPASVLQAHQDATVIIDDEAASLLAYADYYRFADANRP